MMKKVWKIVSNKFVFTGSIFLIWMLFFDQNDWFSQQQYKKQLRAAENNITYLKKQIAQMENDKIALTNDKQRIEQFAREHFHMKKDNEDLYLISQ